MEGWQNNFQQNLQRWKQNGSHYVHCTYIQRNCYKYAVQQLHPTADIDNSATLSDGEILLQGEAAMEGLGLTEMDLTPDLDIQR